MNRTPRVLISRRRTYFDHGGMLLINNIITKVFLHHGTSKKLIEPRILIRRLSYYAVIDATP
ncbi:hypothetical protein Sjap_024255 [Stephania japonica]|uniref:Uncharacterized protein n=1 Tax=Stephania japonica TaxID=461633 RepID=A0AAP0HJP7_9MAGN